MRSLGFFLVVAAALAQQVSSDVTLRAGPVYVQQFPNLEIVVETAGAQPVSAAPSDFILLEDGVRTTTAEAVRKFSDTGQGVSVVLALDASGSMRGRPLDAVRRGLGQFVAKARDNDKIGVLSFADDARWEANWSASRDETRQKIGAISARGTRTVLWDALDAALDALAEQNLPARRHLVVISDGHDEGSKTRFEDVLAKALRLRIPVDAIGLTRSNPRYLENLQVLAAQTQGLYSAARDEDTLTALVGHGIDRMLDSPVLRFTAANIKADGAQHRLGVYWKSVDKQDEAPFQAPAVSASSTGSQPDRNPPQHTSQHERRFFPLHYTFEWWHAAAAGGLLALLVIAVALRLRARSRAEIPMMAPEPIVFSPPNDRPINEPVGPYQPPVDLFSIQPEPRPASPPPPAPVFPVQAVGPAAVAAGPSAPPRARTRFAAQFPPPSNGGPAAVLVAKTGPFAGRVIPVTRADFWLGAAPNNDLTIPDETVTGNHAWLHFEADTLKIFDNHSTNNTWVNGQPVGETARLLFPGDEIRIGRSVLVVERANVAQSANGSALP